MLFELIAHRYESRSLAIAANQPFGAWEQLFPDKATTVAAIDRLVHHASILEMNAESFRRRTADAPPTLVSAARPAPRRQPPTTTPPTTSRRPTTTTVAQTPAAAGEPDKLVVAEGQKG